MLQKFNAKRAELKRLKYIAIENILKKNKEYQSIISANLK